MLEKQRIHLEGLIDNLVSSAIEAEQKIGTDKVEMAMEARRMAGDRVKEYLDFIQSYMGTQRCASCGCSPNMLNFNPTPLEPTDFYTREED